MWLYPEARIGGSATFLTATDITWSGPCVDGKVSGIGTIELHTTLGLVHYEGGMRGGKANGHGTLTLFDGSSISGEFTDGGLDGAVVFISPKGMHYEGEWRNGSQEGYGTATMPNGIRYEGAWHRGMWHGIGTLESVPKVLYWIAKFSQH